MPDICFNLFRAGSIIPEDEIFGFGQSEQPARRESTAFSVKRRGTSTTYNSKESVYLPDATSMEKLSDKVCARIAFLTVWWRPPVGWGRVYERWWPNNSHYLGGWGSGDLIKESNVFVFSDLTLVLLLRLIPSLFVSWVVSLLKKNHRHSISDDWLNYCSKLYKICDIISLETWSVEPSWYE